MIATEHLFLLLRALCISVSMGHINGSDSKINTLFHLAQQLAGFSRTRDHWRQFSKTFTTEINCVLKSEMKLLLLHAKIIAT